MRTEDAPREVPFDWCPPDRRVMVFGAFTARCQVYGGYKGVPEGGRAQAHHLVLMAARWDGRLGFVGGGVERGERDVDALLREAAEEAALSGLDPARFEPVVAHESRPGGAVLRLYRYDLGEVSAHALARVASAAALADHAAPEGFVTWWRLTDAEGRRALRDRGNLATAVAEELDALVAAPRAPAAR